MKKVLIVLIIWSLLLTALYGCGTDKPQATEETPTQTTFPQTEATEPKSIAFQAQYIETSSVPESGYDYTARIIRSAEELDEYYQQYREGCGLDKTLDSGAISFLEAKEAYDSSFFENHSLILAAVLESIGSPYHKVTDVSYMAGDRVFVEIDSITSSDIAIDFTGHAWHIFVEVEEVLDDQTVAEVQLTRQYIPSSAFSWNPAVQTGSGSEMELGCHHAEVIRSPEELEEYYTRHKGTYGLDQTERYQGYENFRERMACYDSSFFEENSLILAAIHESGTPSHVVWDVSYAASDRLLVEIDSILPPNRVHEKTSSTWHVFVTVNERLDEQVTAEVQLWDLYGTIPYLSDKPLEETAAPATDVPFQAKYIAVGDGPSYGGAEIVAINSVQALEDHYAQYKDKYGLDLLGAPNQTTSFLDAKKQYDSSFFESNSLLLAAVKLSGNAVPQEVTEVIYYPDNKSFVVTVDCITDETRSAESALGCWQIFIELDEPIDFIGPVRVQLSKQNK